MAKTMHVLLGMITIAFGMVFLPTIANGVTGFSFQPEICGVESKLFLKEIAEASPAQEILDVLIAAMNDIRCEKNDYMANMLIVITEEPGKYLFNIFHVHFSPEGKLISTATNTAWTSFTDLDDVSLFNAWCAFTKSMYHEDFKNAGCDDRIEEQK